MHARFLIRPSVLVCRTSRGEVFGYRQEDSTDATPGLTAPNDHGVYVDGVSGTDILGHSSPTTIELIYVEVIRESQRSTADKLGYLFEA